MNRAVVIVLALACVGMADAMVAGAGLMIGEPVGLSLRLCPRPNLLFCAGAGYAWWQDSSVQIQGDLMFLSSRLTKDRADGALGLCMGLGVQARLAGTPKNPSNRMGLRMPLGIEYIFPNVPIGIYALAIPIFNLGTTDQYFSGDAIFGFHYYWFTRS